VSPDPRGAGADTAGAPSASLLIALSGRDRPGLTARIFDALSGTVLDLEQTVVHGRLVQLVHLGFDAADDLAAVQERLEEVARSLELDVEIVATDAAVTRRDQIRHRVSIMAAPLRPDAVARVARLIADAGGNIERIERIAAYPVTAVEITVLGADIDGLRREIALAAGESGVDLSIQPLTIDRFARHLVVLDVDSTLIQDEVIELLAARVGAQERVAEITERAMRGELDFRESLRERAHLLAGAPASIQDEVRDQLRLTPGARTLCRILTGLGHEVALVSGGFTEVIRPLATELGVSLVRANTLEVAGGRLTGRVLEPIIDRAGKAEALRAFAEQSGIPLSRTIAIGDGANDLDMLAVAGLGVAFNAKPVVREAADTAVNVPYLDSVLFLMGMTREEIEAADVS
jgi:phosphoserine phosphatase